MQTSNAENTIYKHWKKNTSGAGHIRYKTLSYGVKWFGHVLCCFHYICRYIDSWLIVVFYRWYSLRCCWTEALQQHTVTEFSAGIDSVLAYLHASVTCGGLCTFVSPSFRSPPTPFIPPLTLLSFSVPPLPFLFHFLPTPHIPDKVSGADRCEILMESVDI